MKKWLTRLFITGLVIFVLSKVLPFAVPTIWVQLKERQISHDHAESITKDWIQEWSQVSLDCKADSNQILLEALSKEGYTLRSFNNYKKKYSKRWAGLRDKYMQEFCKLD